MTSAADNGDDINPVAGSLRAAIITADADTSAGPDTIALDIPGSGRPILFLQLSPPAITRTVVVDGTTQPGYSPDHTEVDPGADDSAYFVAGDLHQA